MITIKPRSAQTLAAWTWVAVGLTPAGWFWGFVAIAYSHLGDVTDASPMLGGVALFAAAPVSAFILAVYTARAGHRSGKIAVAISGLLLLATLGFLTWVYWWAGLPVTGVAVVLILAWMRSRRVAVAVSGLLLLALLLSSSWLAGGWVNAAMAAVAAVVAVLALAWLSSHGNPPPGPDGARHEESPPAAPPSWTSRSGARPRLPGS
jgi:hypothetical protein